MLAVLWCCQPQLVRLSRANIQTQPSGVRADLLVSVVQRTCGRNRVGRQGRGCHRQEASGRHQPSGIRYCTVTLHPLLQLAFSVHQKVLHASAVDVSHACGISPGLDFAGLHILILFAAPWAACMLLQADGTVSCGIS